jgi:Zn-dependent metalloprotease
MKRLYVILLLAFVSTAFLAAPGFAQQQGPPDDAAPDSVRRAAAAQFQADHGPAWQIRWSEKTGTPATLMSGTARGYGGPPEQAGRTFLSDHRNLFGIENARKGLRIARQNASQNGGAQVLYQQVYRGVPVLASGYLVAVNESGEVYYVSGDYYPDLKLETTSPSVSAQAVVRHMRGDLDTAGPTGAFTVLEQPELVVYVEEGAAGDAGADAGSAAGRLSYHLAYVAEAQRRSPLAAFKYVIDAQSGAVLYKTSLVEDAGRHGPGLSSERAATGEGDGRAELRAMGSAAIVNGSGEVYKTNPLHGSPVTETLHRLRDRSPRELYGYEIDVNDRFGSDVTSSSGEFDYSPSNFRFDQVMVYYHSNDFEAWLVGDLGWNDDTGEVDAETRSAACYACTVPSQENAFYSDGSGSAFRNPTREASVMAHEQMHIVSEKFNDLESNDPNDTTQDALDEGYSDYFAVAYRLDRQGGASTEVGEYALVSSTVDINRQLENDFDDRTADNDNGGFNNFYDASLVFTGALWDFTTDVATDVEEAATITLGSLGLLDADPSFLDARNALIAAANNDQKSYTCGIKDVFADHGIGESFASGFLGDFAVYEPGSHEYQAFTGSCAASSVSYEWYIVFGEPGNETESFRDNGPTYSLYISEDVHLRLKTISGTDTVVTDATVRYHGDDFGGGDGCLQSPCTFAQGAGGASQEVLPDAFALEDAYPNPVQASGAQAQIRFALPEPANVEIALYDMLGREVARLVDEQMLAGFHRASVEASGLSSGVYLYRMRATGNEQASFTDTGKLVVVK